MDKFNMDVSIFKNLFKSEELKSSEIEFNVNKLSDSAKDTLKNMYNLNIPIEAKRYYIESLIEVNNKIEDYKIEDYKIEDYKKTLEDLITPKEILEKLKNDDNDIISKIAINTLEKLNSTKNKVELQIQKTQVVDITTNDFNLL